MKITQLETFIAVAEELHFRRAAQRLYTQTSTVSTTIKQLETEYGTPLFNRNSRNVQLTPAGQELLEKAKNVLASVDDLQQTAHRLAFRQQSSLDRGDHEISIAVASDTDRSRVLAAINRLRTVYAAVRTDRVGDHRGAEMLASREVHAAVSWSDLDDLGLDRNSYYSRVLLEDPLNCIVTRSDPLADLAEISVDDIVGRKVVMFHRELAPTAYDVIMDFLRSSGNEPDLIAYQHSQASMADALAWNPGAITFGSGSNLGLLPPQLLGVPVPGRTTPVYIHAMLEWSTLVDEMVRYVSEF